MALVNSLLFLLSTAAPFQDSSSEWHPDPAQVLGGFPERECGPGEAWSLCLAACLNQRNCSNLQRRIICPPECVSGCACEHGTVRNDDGLCVDPWHCPAHLAVTGDTKAKEPSKNSSPRSEFKLEDLDNWIPECGPNERYTLCPRLCPDDCGNFAEPGRVCRLVCRPWPGCQCAAGFVRGPDRACIRPQHCPPDTLASCDENEEYLECGSACPRNCTNPDGDVPCPAKCVPGCFCKRPLLRGPTGRCVHPRECPDALQRVCGEGEELLECGPSCEADCGQRGTACGANRSCRSGCFCRQGLVRGPAGRCVPPARCPKN